MNGFQDFLSGLPVELSGDQISELRRMIGNDENAKRQAIDFMCRPDRVDRYLHLTAIDDYFPGSNSPYEVLAEIAEDDAAAFDFCVEGMWNSHGFAKVYAIKSLSGVAKGVKHQEAIDEIRRFMEYECTQNTENCRTRLYIGAAIEALYEFGEPGRETLQQYDNREGFEVVNFLKRLPHHQPSLVH